MSIFKKKSFLNRNSATDLIDLILSILTINRNNYDDTTSSRGITFLVLIIDILVFQRDNEKKILTEKDFETILELEYLNTLANTHQIKDIDLHKRLEKYLLSIPNNRNAETQQFKHSETSKEQHDYIVGEIKKTLPVIKVLDSRNY